MSRTRSGRLLAGAAPTSKAATAPVVDLDFAERWNATDRFERRQIRRLVRVGRPQESAEHAELAVGFAEYQRTRSWYRRFWLWIVPLAVAGLIAGLALHPIVIGMVIAGVGSAYLARRNFSRVEQINAELLRDEAILAAA